MCLHLSNKAKSPELMPSTQDLTQEKELRVRNHYGPFIIHVLVSLHFAVGYMFQVELISTLFYFIHCWVVSSTALNHICSDHHMCVTVPSYEFRKTAMFSAL